MTAEGGGICVDLAGNIYVGMRLLPKEYAMPAGFEKDPAYNTWTGSIVKFPPTGGTVLGAVKADDVADAEKTKIPCNGNRTVVALPGHLPWPQPIFRRQLRRQQQACVCRVSRFGIDRYARLVYANSVTCSTTLIDNAGNKILEFGAYGNFDSQYVTENKNTKPAITSPNSPSPGQRGRGYERFIHLCAGYLQQARLAADKTWRSTDRRSDQVTVPDT